MTQEQIDDFIAQLTPDQKVAIITTLIGEFQRVYAEAHIFARKVKPQ